MKYCIARDSEQLLLHVGNSICVTQYSE